MCSLAGMLMSGLNLGNHFSAWSGKSCKGAGILIAPGLVQGLCAIIVTTVEGVVETGGVWIEVVGIDDVGIEDDWTDDAEITALCWVGVGK